MTVYYTVYSNQGTQSRHENKSGQVCLARRQVKSKALKSQQKLKQDQRESNHA